MKISLSELDFGPEEQAAVLRVLDSQWISMGGETEQFEQEFAAMAGVRHAIAVSNGTAALHLSLLALEIGAGASVVQPAVNFVASANVTCAVGAEPVFAEICGLDEPTLAPEATLRALEDASRPPPRAVVVMHYGGFPCRMGEIRDLCTERGLALIEDACHGVGGTWRSLGMGAIGDVGCFSFYSNKNLAVGEGGMVTTNRDDVAARVRSLRSHGMTSLTWDRHKGHAATYDVTDHGFNYRIDEIRAAIGREQLKKLSRNNERRRRASARYWERLAPLEERGWVLPFRDGHAEGRLGTPSCHLMVAVAPDRETRWRCSDALKAAGIQTSLHYPFIPSFEAFRKRGASAAGLATSERFCDCVLTLPLFPTISEVQTDTVCGALLEAAVTS